MGTIIEINYDQTPQEMFDIAFKGLSKTERLVKEDEKAYGDLITHNRSGIVRFEIEKVMFPKEPGILGSTGGDFGGYQILDFTTDEMRAARTEQGLEGIGPEHMLAFIRTVREWFSSYT